MYLPVGHLGDVQFIIILDNAYNEHLWAFPVIKINSLG